MKNRIRKEKRELRNQLSLNQQKQYSHVIHERLAPFLENVNNIGIYASAKGEVDTWNMLNGNEDRCYAIPKVIHEDMIFYRYDKDQLQRSKFGIYEPSNQDIMNVDQLEVIVVPLVAFDEKRNRLGYGKGFYDRYLKDFKGLSIGIAYECQKNDEIICESHDIPLDIIVSECYTYK